jgi:hypothetical protein
MDDVTSKSTAEEGLENCKQSVKNVIGELVEDISYNGLAPAESDIIQDRSDNGLNEMESPGEFKKDILQGK